MSDFQELIGSFPKTREYVRDFFVYGFKSREEFKEKSPRTYDNERRRLECWLAPYVRKDYAANGSNISLAIDSNLLDTNPLFQVWKTKSFTDYDITLHFLILDLLQNREALTADEITCRLLSDYDTLFDTQTVRRKCNAYANLGLLEKQKSGKTVRYFLDLTLTHWLKSNEAVFDALAFYQLAECFGIVGNELSEQLDFYNRSFRVKHSFFVHTLEDEILLALTDAMNKKKSVRLTVKGTRGGTPATAVCVPLQIFVSTRSGRRFLCGYVDSSKRFSCFRLDSIKAVSLLEESDCYDERREQLDRNRRCLWGVSFQGSGRAHLERLTMSIQVSEPDEHYIAERLRREGRGGIVTRIKPDVYRYEIEVFDCNEMLPWIRTFIGRILSLSCTAKSVERRFYQDLQTMYNRYHIEAGQELPPKQGENTNGIVLRNL